jgi:hypothetical protein
MLNYLFSVEFIQDRSKQSFVIVSEGDVVAELALDFLGD